MEAYDYSNEIVLRNEVLELEIQLKTEASTSSVGSFLANFPWAGAKYERKYQ